MVFNDKDSYRTVVIPTMTIQCIKQLLDISMLSSSILYK